VEDILLIFHFKWKFLAFFEEIEFQHVLEKRGIPRKSEEIGSLILGSRAFLRLFGTGK
jgi:hypothetical protein